MKIWWKQLKDINQKNTLTNRELQSGGRNAERFPSPLNGCLSGSNPALTTKKYKLKQNEIIHRLSNYRIRR